METEKAAITKGRGPRRVGLKRTSISKSMPSPVDIDSASKVDSEETDSPAVKPIENDVPKTDDVTLGLRLEVNNVTDSVDHSTSVEPQVEAKDVAVKALKSEENETEVSSEDSEEFHGFQSLPSPDGKAKPILTKLLGEAESELDCENNMSDSDKMDVDPENDTADAADIALKVATKSVENGKPSLSEDEDVKEADGSFDNMKLLSEVSSEVTSSNDISNTNLNDSPVKASDETTSEVTSSATNSPSLSAARGNGKGSASRKSLVSSPANVSRKSIAIKKTSVDVANPAFRKPFDFGWKRELVYRNSNETSSKVMADIYYYTPAGKKIRSNREVSEHLHGVDLTTDNFTFFKEALGVEDPEKEIIRVAKRVSGVTAQRSPQPKKQATPKPPRPLKEVKEKESPESAVKVGGPKAAARSFPRIKITPTQLMRSSPSSGGKGKGKRIRSSSDDGDMEMGMLPPTWNPSAAKPAPSSKKRKREIEKEANVAKRGKKSSDVCELEHSFMEFFANNLSAGYSAIKQVFQYLKVKELLRAARVCKMWRDLAGHESLWRIVRMKNSQVDDWEGFVTSLVRHGTQQLDLRKILLPNDPDDINKMWRSFLKEMSRATGIVRIDLCRCPAFVVEELPLACPQLTVVNALAIKCSTISLDTLANLANIQELRLKSMTGIHLTSSLAALKGLKNLKHLSLTTFKDLGKAGPEVINSLTNLETLEIGECSDFPEDFGKEVLPNLTKLTSLRLEKGQGKTCPTFSLLAGVKELPTLNQLELVNFDVKTGFSEALAQCTNIKRLLIIPTYVTQSATTNHMVLAGVTELSESLSHFVWGVTHELLRVTELFIDQCDTKEGGGAQGKVPKAAKSPDSIPILKPDASSKIDDWEGVACKSMSSPVGQVEILTLTKLQQVLTKSLPNTKIKILKVAFQSTWRQSISEPNL